MKWRLINGDRTLELMEASEVEVEHLALHFTRKSPAARFDPRVKRGVWDGNISYFKGGRYLASGLWGELLDMCRKMDFPLQVEGIERLFDHTVKEDEFRKWAADRWSTSHMKNRDYQVETAYKMVRNKSCLAELATSAGKSLIAFMAIAYMMETRRAKRVLVIVPTVDLVTQVVSDFESYNRGTTNLPLVFQKVFSGQEAVEGAHVVAGTYQSLVKRGTDWLSEFDLVLVDEVHKAKSHSIKSILERCTGSSRRLGLSGTIPKEETLDRLTVMSNTGPIVTSIRAAKLIEEGYISDIEIFVIEMSYAPDDVRKSFREIYNQGPDYRKKLLDLERGYAMESTPRLRFITDFVLKNKKNSLVLFHRVDYGRAIYDTLRQKSDRQVYFVSGDTGSDFRDTYKAFMEQGEGKILVASFGTFSTGINITNLHVVYLTESFKSDVIIKQSIGRGLRKHGDKDRLIVVDFVDDYKVGKFTNYLYRHAIERRRIYSEEKFRYSVRKVTLDTQTEGLFS